MSAAPTTESSDPVRPSWTFLTNHAHVLIAISRDGELRQRDISRLVGITEGAVQRILHELEGAGYLRRERVGRRNRYHVDADRPLRHPLERDRPVAAILRGVNDGVHDR
jgi:DNA-binding Lrp family transcriptional regulator